MDRGAWRATVHGVTKSWTQVTLSLSRTVRDTHKTWLFLYRTKHPKVSGIQKTFNKNILKWLFRRETQLKGHQLLQLREKYCPELEVVPLNTISPRWPRWHFLRHVEPRMQTYREKEVLTPESVLRDQRSIPSFYRWKKMKHKKLKLRCPSLWRFVGVHWKDWCWGWNSNTLATSCEELTHWKRPWCWEGLGAGGEGDDRGWDGWMASPTRYTWVWVNSRSWWWTGRPGVLRVMGSQRAGHDWATELNWTPFEILMRYESSPQKSVCVCVCVRMHVCHIYKSAYIFRSSIDLLNSIPRPQIRMSDLNPSWINFWYKTYKFTYSHTR